MLELTDEDGAVLPLVGAHAMHLVVLELAPVLPLLDGVPEETLAIFLAVLELPLVLVLLGDVLAEPMDLVLFELALVELDQVPLVATMPVLLAVLEVARVVRDAVVHLLALPVGQVAQPPARVEYFLARKRTGAFGLVELDLALVEGAVLLDEESNPALGRSFLEAAFVDGPVVIDEPAGPMR